ncbi:PREDICTED: uncharacterized protein LOC109581038 [Amphimedon queenslandica]|uniref:Protein kinase domain-containing protein n=1 Tax=Amphimedon queenslandica TaxID=400682 RepID=A0AAN0IZZ6_AMPQE|nr:PREDICTED: uncharacterized protein LOC109581038 [Amphimedon queenslandica]|eukprot:XP_019850330.1 PREDICTED: uncharacterized protein LOC109581038 [Amphimedon queenslandica]
MDCPRFLYRAVSVRDSLYVWGGLNFEFYHDPAANDVFTSTIQHFTPSTGQWITRDTSGTPPLGIWAHCCTAINHQLYYFGGTSQRGQGPKPTFQLPDYRYELPASLAKKNGEEWLTNEHSLYNLSLREWSNPSVIGQCTLWPASFFVIEKINNTRAVVFGGCDSEDEDAITNNIYILEIHVSTSTVFWQCIKKSEAIDQWPAGRFLHAGAVIVTELDCPMLVISGGWDKKQDVLDDCWIFNITQHSWIKLDVPHSVSKRLAHSLSVFVTSPHCVWIMTVGGLRKNEMITHHMSTELVFNSKGECLVGDTYDSSDYKQVKQLQLGRSLCLEEHHKPSRDSVHIESTIQALMKSLDEKKREVQIFHQQIEEKEREQAEKEQEIRRYCHRLQEMEREKQEALLEKDREYQVVLQEKDREVQEKDRELRQSQEAVRRYQQQALTDDYWVINRDEVTLTEEELGRGSFAVVTVGIFRGLRVAVKSLHAIIISDYNQSIFFREMSIASQVRHPNLVQFIGATKVGNPLILTELMSTSLNQELQRNRLTNQQILSIAQDVALALNYLHLYLHLFKPQPIIHRDVSSPNILLNPSTGPAGYEAKVADYGTAKLQQGTSTGTVMPGNVAYAAPEARDPDQHSPAMDVYSYSVLLMEMNLCCPPEMTTGGRWQQTCSVSSSDMKFLIQRGLHTRYRARPTMAQVIETLKRIKFY